VGIRLTSEHTSFDEDDKDAGSGVLAEQARVVAITAGEAAGRAVARLAKWCLDGFDLAPRHSSATAEFGVHG
jgi:hypothetical protein